jgi:uncharacterized membrane protein YraQ (UPF0718 family)
MIEIISKMVLCLVIALLLGFLVGWLFSRALNEESDCVGLDIEEESEDELIVRIKQLEKLYENEKALSEEYQIKNKKLKGELMKKVNLLNTTSETLKESQNKIKNQDLKERLAKKESELMEFERVLIKAEETIESQKLLIAKLQKK